MHYNLKRVLKSLLAALAILLLLAYLFLPVARAIIIAHPARSPICCASPSDDKLESQDVSFQTSNGLTVRGWYIPSQNGAAIIVAHGYLENRTSHFGPAVALAKAGYGVLLIDLLAHGASDGSTLSLDGKEIVAAAQSLKNEMGINARRIGALGFSLGGLDALQAVIADAPFPVSTLQDEPPPETMQDRLWLPFDAVQFQALAAQEVTPHASTIEMLNKIAPRSVLLIAGIQNRGEQRVIENYFSHALTNTPLWEIPEAGHIGGWSARPQEYSQHILAFFAAELE